MIDTSLTAHQNNVPRAVSQRQKVLRVIREAGESGLTYDRVATLLGLCSGSVTSRLNQLLRSGSIKRSGQRRKTVSGCYAHVYVANRNEKPRSLQATRFVI